MISETNLKQEKPRRFNTAAHNKILRNVITLLVKLRDSRESHKPTFKTQIFSQHSSWTCYKLQNTKEKSATILCTSKPLQRTKHLDWKLTSSCSSWDTSLLIPLVRFTTELKASAWFHIYHTDVQYVGCCSLDLPLCISASISHSLSFPPPRPYIFPFAFQAFMWCFWTDMSKDSTSFINEISHRFEVTVHTVTNQILPRAQWSRSQRKKVLSHVLKSYSFVLSSILWSLLYSPLQWPNFWLYLTSPFIFTPVSYSISSIAPPQLILHFISLLFLVSFVGLSCATLFFFSIASLLPFTIFLLSSPHPQHSLSPLSSSWWKPCAQIAGWHLLQTEKLFWNTLFFKKTFRLLLYTHWWMNGAIWHPIRLNSTKQSLVCLGTQIMMQGLWRDWSSTDSNMMIQFNGSTIISITPLKKWRGQI